MRVLVIGAGRMGTIRVEDLAADPRVDEVLIANRTPERAAALAERHRGRQASGADQSSTARGRVVPWSEVTTTDADAFVVAVGTDAHDDLLTAVLAHRRPVLCEKPIALTLEGTRAVIAVAEHHGAPLQIGFQRRFDPAISAVRTAIAAGDLGTLYSLTMTAHDHTPSAREFIAGSGGIFRDMLVHDFDLVRWLTGSEVAHVYATSAVREHVDYADFDDADVASVTLVTTSGAQVIVTGTRHDALGHDVRLEVFGSLDSVAAGLNQRTPLRAMEADLRLNSDPYTGFVDRFREAFRAETAAFISLARGEIDNPCPPDSALESLRIAIACERSVATGLPVRVADISGP